MSALSGTPSAGSWGERLNGYGAVLVTVFVFVLLFLAMGVTAFSGDKQTFGTLVETIQNLAMVAGGFWLRSLSSQKKDDTIAGAISALATSTPPPAAMPPPPPPETPPPAPGADRPSLDAEIEALRQPATS